MKFTDEDLENIKKSFSYDDAVKLLKAMANHEKFITKGLGKGLIDAYNIDINQFADYDKMQKK